MNEELKTLYRLVLVHDWVIFECGTENNVTTIRLAASTAGPFAEINLEPMDDQWTNNLKSYM